MPPARLRICPKPAIRSSTSRHDYDVSSRANFRKAGRRKAPLRAWQSGGPFALAETALLFLLSGIVVWEATKRLVEHEAHVVEATVWAFAVIVVSIIVDFFRARALSHTAEKTSSHALEADALHFSSDLWSSLAVLVGLIGVRFGFPWADSVAALVVAVLVCIAGWKLAKRTVDTLTD